jgi:hypothetical protein
MKQIFLKGTKGKGLYVLVDEEDYEKLNQKNWYLHKNGYAFSNDFTKMHRYILNYTGTELMVDHKNRNKLDNRKSNLRLCTRSQNMQNSISGYNKKYKGVFIIKNKRFNTQYIVSKIVVNKKTLYIGTYKNLEDAAKAYDVAAVKYFGEFALTNF